MPCVHLSRPSLLVRNAASRLGSIERVVRALLPVAFVAQAASGCRCIDLSHVTFPDSGGEGGGTDDAGDDLDAAVPCGPSNCAGCCDQDTCVPSNTAQQCGLGGIRCQSCSGAADDPCTAGVCAK